MIELRKIEHQSIRKKWQRRFARYHDGKVKAWSAKLSGQSVRFFVASDDKHELGFIGINDKSNFFASCTDAEVWNLTEAFVKPAYRHNGVLRAMITQAVRDHNVRMISIPADSFACHSEYYAGLGFTCFYPVHNGDMIWAFQAGFAEIARGVMQKRPVALAMAGGELPDVAGMVMPARHQERLLAAR